MLTAAALAAALAAHAPVVVHDSRERFPLTSVAAAPVNVPGIDRDRRPAVYGRVVRSDGGEAWLQYWLFYRGQDQDRGIVRTGATPATGRWCSCAWTIARGRCKPSTPSTPAPSAARGRRCSGAAGGRSSTRRTARTPPTCVPAFATAPSPTPTTRPTAAGSITAPRLVRITASSPRWMRWPGRWGGARARWWNPVEQDSPAGPAFQGQGRWSDPDAWADAARSCRAGCDEVGECDWRENALAAARRPSSPAAAVLGGGGRRRRLRRSRA